MEANAVETVDAALLEFASFVHPSLTVDPLSKFLFTSRDITVAMLRFVLLELLESSFPGFSRLYGRVPLVGGGHLDLTPPRHVVVLLAHARHDRVLLFSHPPPAAHPSFIVHRNTKYGTIRKL